MFKKSNFFLTILILILGLALNSFSSTKGLETASNNQVLKDTKWELKSLNKKDIKKVEKVAIINFEKENKVFGNLGCNSFFGKVDIKPNNINISKVDKINTTKGLLNISLFLSKNTGMLYSLKITLVILS